MLNALENKVFDARPLASCSLGQFLLLVGCGLALFESLSAKMNAVQTKRRSRLITRLSRIRVRASFAILLALLGMVVMYCAFAPAAEDDPNGTGGMCEALGERRSPPWVNRRNMRKVLPSFLRIYSHRPFKNNKGGMLLDHSFALFYVLRAVRPEVVIESGSFKGHSTWMVRQALGPKARIISLDPMNPSKRLPDVEYIVKDDFKDFNVIDWQAMGVDPSKTVVIFDDHQSGFRRVQEARAKGFKRVIAEDNYDYLNGDNLSLRWVCERTRKDEWRGTVTDNFAKTVYPQTWDEHLQQGEHLKSILRFYYEFPPIASTELTEQNRYDPARADKPLITSRLEFKLLLYRMPKSLFNEYTHFTYVETI